MTKPSLAQTLVPLALIAGLVVLLGLRVDSAVEVAMTSPLEPWLKGAVGWLASASEIAAAIVVGVAVLRGCVSFARGRLTPEAIRQQLGRSLALGLEFTIASDILRTSVAPRREDIVNLAAIVLLRTLLNSFLGDELRESGEHG